MLEFKERTNLSADIRDDSGNQKVMLQASFGTGNLNLSVEVLDAAFVLQNADSVAADTAQFIAEVCRRAAGDCALPTGEVVRRTTSPSEQETDSPGAACDGESPAQAASVKAG